jgi:hypothetical protein
MLQPVAVAATTLQDWNHCLVCHTCNTIPCLVLYLAAGTTPGDIFSSTAQLGLLGLHSPFGTDQQLYVRNGRPLSLILGPQPKEEGKEGSDDSDDDESYNPTTDLSLKGETWCTTRTRHPGMSRSNRLVGPA